MTDLEGRQLPRYGCEYLQSKDTVALHSVAMRREYEDFITDEEASAHLLEAFF